MTATPLNPTARYIPPGVRQYYWVPTVADKTAPTRSELDAGTDLTSELAQIAGFQVTSDTVDAPDAGSRFTSKVSGRTTVADSSIDLYTSDDSDDARSLLTRDLAGFVVIFPEGDVPAQTMDVFPVTITSASILPSLTDAAQLEVQFVITSIPVNNVTVPAA